MIDSLTIKDTHALIADLNKKYRIPEKTAEGILYAMQKAQLPPLGNVATKDDITKVTTKLEKKVGEVEKELKKEIGEVEKKVGDVKGEVREIKAMLKAFFWAISGAFSLVFFVLGKLLGIY